MKLSAVFAFLGLFLGFIPPVFATYGKDSVAVFHRAEKVIVLVTEKSFSPRL